MKSTSAKQEMKDAAEALKQAEASLNNYKGKGKLPPDYYGRLAQASQAIQRARKYRGDDDAPPAAPEDKSAAGPGVRHAGGPAPKAKTEEGKVFP